MATLYLRPGSSHYYAKFKDVTGTRVSRNTGMTKKREAQAEANRLEAEERDKRTKENAMPREFASIIETAAREARDGDLTLARAEELLRRLRDLANPSFRESTVTEWFKSWCEDQKRRVSDSTSGSYDDAHRRLMKAMGSTRAKSLTALTVEDVRKAHEAISKTVRVSTANMDLRAFRRALEAAVVEGLCAVNVAKHVKPLPEVDSTERAPFTAKEVRAMIDKATGDEMRGLVTIAAHTGIRMMDVARLSQANIHGTDIVLLPEKGRAKKKVIRIPMTPPVMAWIGDREGDFFPGFKSKTKATISMAFTRLMDKAGVPRKVILPGDIEASRSFHSLRHSFTSWLADADIHSDVRQKLTGHSSAGVHAKYSHHDASLARAVKTLPEL